MPPRRRLAVLAVVVGPGLLAGLSDDDPAGITTYSVLGADYGYRLLWVLLLSTIALVLFHDLGARMGIVTGQGLTGLVREAYACDRQPSLSAPSCSPTSGRPVGSSPASPPASNCSA